MTLNAPHILDLTEISKCLDNLDLIPLIEKGFIALSSGMAVVPPVGELLFEKPKGDVHIKYGYIQKQPHYVIKIASGFYDNPSLGIDSSQGLMLVFSQRTGELKSILLDEGHLTDVRTVIASMITIKHLAPSVIDQIGIVGTGTQAKLQLRYLSQVTDCKKIKVWGRDFKKALDFKKQNENLDFTISIAESTAQLAHECNTIITTTASELPLIKGSDVKAGTHITALGSDTSEKIELDPTVIKKADKVVSDSIDQSMTRGEIFQARNANALDKDKLVELGKVIMNPSLARNNDKEITVADLTGVAVQDIMIADAVYTHYMAGLLK